MSDVDAPTHYLGVPVPHPLRLYWHTGYLSLGYWQDGVKAALQAVHDDPEIIEEWTARNRPPANSANTS